MVKRESMRLCQGVKILQKGVTTVSKKVLHMVKAVTVFCQGVKILITILTRVQNMVGIVVVVSPAG